MAAKKVLSIELGVQTTRICEVDFRSKKPTVYSVCKFDTPDGAIEDGYIRNRELLSVAMKMALGKAGMKNKNVIFSITSSKIANREVNMPVVADNKIEPLIQSNANDYFPVDIDEYVITYKVLDRAAVTNDSDKKMRVLVLAAPSQLIDSYYDFAKFMGFEILAIDYVGNSCYQTVKKQVGSDVSVVIQLNEQNTLINVLNGEILSLQRTIPYGMSNVVEVAINTGEFDIVDRESAIERLLNEQLVNSRLNENTIDDVALQYMENNDDEYSEQLRQIKAREEITETFSYLISNTVRVIDYYAAKNQNSRVSKLHISGVGSHIKGITALFRNEIFNDVDKFEDMKGVDFAKATMVQAGEKSDYMIVVGASIDPVDFIPKQQVAGLKTKNELAGAIAVCGVCLAASVVLIGTSLFSYYMEKSDKEEYQAKIDSYSDVVALTEKKNKVENEKKNADELATKTMNNNTFLDVLFEEIEDVIPKNTHLKSIQSGEEGLALAFESVSWQEVGQMVIGLKDCPLIDKVDVPSITSDLNDKTGRATFTYTANCKFKSIDYSKFIKENPSESSVRKSLGLDSKPLPIETTDDDLSFDSTDATNETTTTTTNSNFSNTRKTTTKTKTNTNRRNTTTAR